MVKLFWEGVRNKKNECTVMSQNVQYLATVVEIFYEGLKFQFVNPGSIECLAVAGFSKETQKLVSSIQKQLLSLRNVLQDLSSQQSFIRWRGSNLTRLLKFGFTEKNSNCNNEENLNKNCLELAKSLYKKVGKIQIQEKEETEELKIINEESN